MLIPILPRGTALDEYIDAEILHEVLFGRMEEDDSPAGPEQPDADLNTLTILATQALSLSRAPALYKQAWDEAKAYLLSHHTLDRAYEVMSDLASFSYDCRATTIEELNVWQCGFFPNAVPGANVANIEQLLNMGMPVPIAPDNWEYDVDSPTMIFLDEVMTSYASRVARLSVGG